jgi:hypothetical protein
VSISEKDGGGKYMLHMLHIRTGGHFNLVGDRLTGRRVDRLEFLIDRLPAARLAGGARE